MRTLFLFLSLISIEISHASVLLTGKVIDCDQKPVDYFNVVLLSPKDSSMVAGGTFTEGKFKFANLKEQAYLIKVSGLGFADFRQSIIVNKATELAPIVLQTKSLKEVSVTAHRPVIQSKADRTIVTVEGSILSNAINGNDMLQKTPGLFRDAKSGDFTVAGKGTPVFYIDGKEVHSMEEVKALNPQNIKTIEIIDNPSSAYDAEGHAVVLITTIRHTERYLLRIGNEFQQARRSANEIYIENVVSAGKITANAYYAHTIHGGHSFETNSSIIAPNSTMNTFNEAPFTDYENDYRASIDWTISKQHVLTFQTNGYFGHSNVNTNQLTQYLSTQYNDFYTYNNVTHHYNQFNGTLNYTWKIDTLGQNLKIVGDYTYGKNDSGNKYYNEIIGSMNSSQFYNTTYNSGKPIIYSIKGDYSIPLGKAVTFEAGSRYYVLKGDNHTNITGSTILLQHYLTTERNTSAYFSLSAKLNDKWNVRIGLRGENMYRKAVKDDITNTHFNQFGLFPSALVNFDCSKNCSFGLSYTKRISRPSFGALDPSLSTDSLWTRQGNPNLKSTDIHAFLLTLKLFSMFSIRTGYNYKINPIYFLVYKNAQNSQVTDCRYVNGANTGNFVVSASFNKSLCKWWSTSVSAELSTNSYVYYDDDNIKCNNNRPLCNGNIQNTFNLPGKITFDTGFQYNGTGSMSTIYVTKPAWNLFGSLQRNFFNDALMCTLSVNDVFRKDIAYQRSVLKGNNLCIFDGDNRYVVLSLKYQIGKSKYQYQSHSATQDEKSRIN